MPFALQLSDARTKLINLASIDGKTGTTARHTVANLNLALNQAYRDLLSEVCQLGESQLLTPSAPAALPGRLVGEDFQSVDLPVSLEELLGVDVQVGGAWQKLDAIEFSQRRDFMIPATSQSSFLFRSAPPNGVGFYAIYQGPSISANGLTLLAGKLAIWPFGLVGNYKFNTVPSWADITGDTQIFMCYASWDTWFINKAVMAITGQRDGNKKGTYDTALQAWQFADAQVRKAAGRLQRSGQSVPTSYGGTVL